MKRLLSIICIVWISMQISYAQPWLQHLPTGKKASELSLYDYKKAFDTYWEPFQVDNRGYYQQNGVKTKAAGWKQFLRWYHNMESQVDPRTGAFPEHTATQVYEAYLAKHPQAKRADASAWTNIGPASSNGGYSGMGRVNCIAFHPTDNDTYWVGAPAGGLWKTTDNGGSWICLTDNNAIQGVSDIAVPSDYASSHTLYIATGDRDASDNRSIGVLKTTDDGVSWQATGLSFTLKDNVMTNRLLMDPNNDQVLIAATTMGVYKTTDGGATWSNKLTNKQFIDMEYKPGDFNVLYGCNKGGVVSNSTDGGANWNSVTLSNGGKRVELAVTPANANYVYALVSASNNGLEGVYRSQDQGANFTQMLSGGTTNLLGWSAWGDDTRGQGWYDLSLAASPLDANLIYVGGINTWKSTDGGSNWQISSHWSGTSVQAVHADKHNLRYRSNGDLFECNDGGVYVLKQGSSSWQDKTNGMIISQMYKLSVSATVAGEVITGLQDNGTKLYSTNSWNDVKGGDGMECLIDYTDVNTQYGTYVRGQISRTTNHWGYATDIEPYAAGSGAWVTPYIIDPVDHNTLYAGYADVWKTTNKGNSWTKISTISTGDKLRSMAIAPSDNKVLCVADRGRIWRTADGGATWNNISGGLPSSSAITYIAIKADDPNTIWVTLGAYNSDMVYESTNGGQTWTNISAGLPEVPANSIVQNKMSTSSVHLYVGTELGVFFKNGEADWVFYNQNMPKVRCGELEVYYDNDNVNNSQLYMASYGRGLWKSPMEAPDIQSPVVVTQAATEVGMQSAKLHAKVTHAGASEVTERGFVWSLNPNPTMADNKVTAAAAGLGEYVVELSSLEPGTVYYYKSYAINAAAATLGSEQQFKTVCSAADVPFQQGFESDVFPPDCWVSFIGANGLGNMRNWKRSATHQEGSFSAYVPAENVSGGLAEDWLVSPMLNITAGTHLSFYQKQLSASVKTSKYAVLVSASSQQDIASFTELESWGEADFSNNFTEKVIDLSAYAGQTICVAFRLTNDNGDGWYVDNVQVMGNSPAPVATIEATAGCATGSVKLKSNLSGQQTFKLLSAEGAVLQEVSIDASEHTFSDVPDGSYKGQIVRQGQASEATAAVSLTNTVVLTTIGEIVGPDIVNETESAVFSVAEVAGADSYEWVMASNWTIESGASTHEISIKFPDGATAGKLQVKAKNVCGESNVAEKMVVVSGVGIPEYLQDKLKLYPNPASEYLHISFVDNVLEEAAEVSVWNIYGQPLMQQHVEANSAEAVLDIRHLAKGTYFVQIQTVAWKADYKLIVK